MPQDLSRSANCLLSSLPETEYQRLEPHLKSVELPLHTVLYEASDEIENIYFPNKALISLVVILENGATIEDRFHPSKSPSITVTTAFLVLSLNSLTSTRLRTAIAPSITTA